MNMMLNQSANWQQTFVQPNIQGFPPAVNLNMPVYVPQAAPQPPQHGNIQGMMMGMMGMMTAMMGMMGMMLSQMTPVGSYGGGGGHPGGMPGGYPGGMPGGYPAPPHNGGGYPGGMPGGYPAPPHNGGGYPGGMPGGYPTPPHNGGGYPGGMPGGYPAPPHNGGGYPGGMPGGYPTPPHNGGYPAPPPIGGEYELPPAGGGDDSGNSAMLELLIILLLEEALDGDSHSDGGDFFDDGINDDDDDWGWDNDNNPPKLETIKDTATKNDYDFTGKDRRIHVVGDFGANDFDVIGLNDSELTIGGPNSSDGDLGGDDIIRLNINDKDDLKITEESAGTNRRKFTITDPNGNTVIVYTEGSGRDEDWLLGQLRDKNGDKLNSGPPVFTSIYTRRALSVVTEAAGTDNKLSLSELNTYITKLGNGDIKREIETEVAQLQGYIAMLRSTDPGYNTTALEEDLRELRDKIAGLPAMKTTAEVMRDIFNHLAQDSGSTTPTITAADINDIADNNGDSSTISTSDF